MAADDDGGGTRFLEFARAVGELNRSLVAVGEAIAGAAGLSYAGSRCLRQVVDRPATVADIAAQLGLARQGVQRVADLLAAEGLATYVDNPRHRRAKLLCPAEAGLRALAAMDAAHQLWIDNAAGELVHADIALLTRQLQDTRVVVTSTRIPGWGG